MFTPDNYQLLDFGDGRRLERFGPLVLDRPCPTAENMRKYAPRTWQMTLNARFERGEGNRGKWICTDELPERWTINHASGHASTILELKRSEFGHLGVFPEQAACWDWIATQLGASMGVRVLNLFAYTGGSTLAAAAAGAEVVHVDSAKNIVAQARRNAELSGLADAPIRWIVEDVMKFVRRELRRKSRYDAVVLDPPSYGHGRRGEVWRLSKHLERLLGMCAELTATRRRFILLTCHTPNYTPERLQRLFHDTFGETHSSETRLGNVTAAPLTLAATTGQKLPSGVVARWQEKR